MLFRSSVYENFYKFSAWAYTQTDSTYKISLTRLGELLFIYLREVKDLDDNEVGQIMINDMMKLKGRAIPSYLKPFSNKLTTNTKDGSSGFNKRQQ